MKSPRFPRIVSRFGTPEETEQPPKPTTFEILTKLILPALGLVALIIAQLQQQRTLLWALLAFVLLSLATAFLPSKIRHRVRERRDERVARRAFPEFKRFLRQFGEFVDYGRSDCLHEIAFRELCQNRSDVFDRLRIVPVHLFNGFWWYLRARNERETRNLLDSIQEFNHLVISYCTSCTQPIFDRFPEDLRPLLTPQVRASLESFRERFVGFLDDYSEYLKNLDDSFSTPRIRSYYFPRPKPL